jgi:hypothetical protein
MKTRLALLLTILLSAGFASRAGAAVSQSYSFQVAKAPHPLAPDPSMSDPAWQAGKVPGDGPWMNVTTRRPADERTSVFLLYDDENLYVGFVSGQTSAPILASQATNDVGFGTDDFVAVGIDTSGAGSQAYFFETTPRGVRYQQASENVRFRPNWQSSAAADGTTWRAVMTIPLRAMRLRPGSSQTWRIGFFRSIAARAEHLSWSYDPIMQDLGAGSWPSFGDLRFWPRATGIALSTTAAMRPKPRLEMFELSSSGVDRNLYQQANGTFQPQQSRSLGADLSYPITPTINLVGTANPDFSNVEIDQQTIAPQEFSRRLTEYRPFFAQGAQYLNPSPAGYTNFNAPNNEVFYSPGVGPFDSGAKIEGAYGLQSVGALSFRGFNEVTGETFNDQAFGYHHLLQDGTFQYWADGVLAHHSIAGTDDTYEYGARGRNLTNGFLWQINNDIERGSRVPQGIAHSTNGAVDVHKPNYEAIVQYADISPTYDPLDGFTTIADIRGLSGYVNLNGSRPGVKSWSIFFQGDRLRDRSGAVHQADFNAFFNAVFKNGLSINGLGPSTSELRGYDGNFLTGYPSYAHGATVPFNFMGVPLGYGDGTPTPVDVSANWGSFGGNYLHLYTAQTSRPLGSRYSLGVEYDGSYERGLTTGAVDSQWLRRASLGFNMGASSNLTLSLRSINGRGGFSTQPGLNLAAAFHTRTNHGDLYVNFGSPSAFATLDRVIVKYVLRIGADAGT